MSWLLIVLAFAMSSAAQGDGIVYSTVCVADTGASISTYPVFSTIASVGPLLPGLSGGFIPQGLAWLEEERWFLVSGYRPDDGASVIFAIDSNDGSICKETFLMQKDGSIYSGHAGGICVTESSIFIADGDRFLRLDTQKYLASPKTCVYTVDSIIKLPCKAAYCACNDGILWVGEFVQSRSSLTGVLTSDDENEDKSSATEARLFGYLLSSTGDQEFDEKHPDYIIYTPDRVQGMAYAHGVFYFSCSFGRRNNSTVYRYTDITSEETTATAELNGEKVSAYRFDNHHMLASICCPPMSEGMCVVEDEVWILFESAAQRYMSNPWSHSRNPIDRICCLRDW